jgi:type I restriction enzyme R subunit
VAIEVDTIVRHTRPDSRIGSPVKEKQVKRAIAKALPDDFVRFTDAPSPPST